MNSFFLNYYSEMYDFFTFFLQPMIDIFHLYICFELSCATSQRDGMTIVAERLNFLRFISHFSSVHRGAAFARMRTTTVRKLLPEYAISIFLNLPGKF